jgi:hypothetical protein
MSAGTLPSDDTSHCLRDKASPVGRHLTYVYVRFSQRQVAFFVWEGIGSPKTSAANNSVPTIREFEQGKQASIFEAAPCVEMLGPSASAVKNAF